MTTRVHTVAVHNAEPDEGGYWCEVLELPGCVAQGETLDELRANVEDAIEAWEQTQQEDGQPIIDRPVTTWSICFDSGVESFSSTDG
jgi:predicted RNase H-like HicB family nuclease